jgi:hypothetical protein
MPIPKTRVELSQQLLSTFGKLRVELDGGGSRLGNLPCVDGWTVKDLLAVRVWWTENVVAWIEAGRRGEIPVTPAEGYKWNETPRLNADIVKAAQREPYQSIRSRLEHGYAQVLNLIDELSDKELLDVGAFPWSGKYPISRWISINTVRQYTTARTFIRRALRAQDASDMNWQ